MSRLLPRMVFWLWTLPLLGLWIFQFSSILSFWGPPLPPSCNSNNPPRCGSVIFSGTTQPGFSSCTCVYSQVLNNLVWLIKYWCLIKCPFYRGRGETEVGLYPEPRCCSSSDNFVSTWSSQVSHSCLSHCGCWCWLWKSNVCLFGDGLRGSNNYYY